MYTTIILVLCSLLSLFHGPWWLSLPLGLVTVLLLIYEAGVGWTIIYSEAAGHEIEHEDINGLNPDKVILAWAKKLKQHLVFWFRNHIQDPFRGFIDRWRNTNE